MWALAAILRLAGVVTLAVGIVSGAKLPDAPKALGEVACGKIGRYVYCVGAGGPGVSDSTTMRYDARTKQWKSSGLASRPHAGDHHGAVVYKKQLILVGGLGANSGNKLQIYNPRTDRWTVKTMPFSTGSPNAVKIGRTLYVCGGIVGSRTVSTCRKMNLSTFNWSTNVANMATGVNHAAHVAAGGKMYVFGGRQGGNTVQNPFDDAQVYNPRNNRWSRLKNMPAGQGGCGRAVARNGRIYIVGGETKTGTSNYASGRVFKFVTEYNIQSDSYSRGATMSFPRHGIWPIISNGKILVCFGGVKAGNSQSDKCETLGF